MKQPQQKGTQKAIAPSQPQAKIVRPSLHPIEELQNAIGNRGLNQLLASQPQLPAKPLFRGLSRELTPQQEEESDSEQGVTPIISTLQRSPLPPQQLPQHPTPSTPSTSEESGVIQAKGETTGDRPDVSVEQRPNKTGMPDALKAGAENLSGYSLNNVRVHYNSPKPTQIQALAFTQGTEIHVAPGKEVHLPHEVWHVVQQMQGRVKPTMQMKGGGLVNDDAELEHEADVMGVKALAPATQRPEKVAQRELADTENDSQSSTAQQAPIRTVLSNLCTTQRLVNVTLKTDEKEKKSLVADGKVKDFKNGTKARRKGWVGVDKYRAWYEIESSDGNFRDKDGVGPLQNSFTNGEAGHILGQQNGGNGDDPKNVFAQDGGTNNGLYKSFEIGMRKTLNLYKDNDKVTFKCYLAGTNIKEGNIEDAALSDASDISSDLD